MQVSWWPVWGEGVVLAAGAALVWALALYVVSRAPVRRVPGLAAAAMLLLAAYQLGEALGALAPDVERWATWLRRTWWAPSLAPGVWLLLSLALAEAEGPPGLASAARRAFAPVAILGLGAGAASSLLGIFSSLIQDWSAPYTSFGLRHAPHGVLFVPFQLYVLVCLVGAAALLVGLWVKSPPGSPLRARFGWLVASAIFFLVAGGWVVVASGTFAATALPGQVVVIAGVLIMGYNLARYGALLAGESVGADFLAFCLAMLAIVAIYGGIILVLAPADFGWIERVLPLLFLVMTTHVVVDTRGHLLDRVLYGALLSNVRGQLRELSNRVVRQPDSVAALVDVRETVDDMLRQQSSASADLTEGADVRMLVESALRRLNDLPALSQHPLISTVETGASPLERAAALRSELEQAVERLRPPGPRPTPGTSNVGGWLHYLVLREAYLDGRPNKQIMQRYALSESTFHRARRRAIDALAVEVAQHSPSRV